MNWEKLRADEFPSAIERSRGLCVIPMGCLEKHGPHLPVGTDSLWAVALTEEAASVEEVCVFPGGMWLGDVMFRHSDKDPVANNMAGFISMNPHTMLTVLEELCDEIARNGFRKILFVNAHGGNYPMLDYFLSGQNYKKRNYATMYTPAFDITTPANMYRTVQERKEEFPYLTEADMEALAHAAQTLGDKEDHAGWNETAMIYAYYPELVCRERMDAEDGLPTHRTDYLKDLNIMTTHRWYANFPNHFDGTPAFGCTERIGRALRQLCVERLAEKFRLLKNDEDCVRMVQGLPCCPHPY